MQALNFTPDDLTANRAGQLSERQRDYLRTTRQRSLLIGGVIIFVLIFVATGFIFVGQQNASPILTFIGAGITICNAAVLGIFARDWFRIGGDLNAGTVEGVSGKAQRVIRVAGRAATYVLRINSEALTMPRSTLAAFQHEASYTIYRTPYSRILLSAEPMD